MHSTSVSIFCTQFDVHSSSDNYHFHCRGLKLLLPKPHTPEQHPQFYICIYPSSICDKYKCSDGAGAWFETYTLHLVEVNFECSHRQLTSQSEKKNMSHLFWQSPLSYSLTSHIKGLLIICHLRYFMCSCGSNMILEWKRLQFWWMFPAAFHCTRYWCCAPLIWPVIFILSDSQKCYQYFSAEYMSLKSCVGLLLISKNRASQWVRQHQQNFDYEQSCNLNHNHILIMEDEPKRHNQQPLVSSNFIRWLMKKFLVSVFWLQYLHVTFLKPIFLKSMFSPVGTCCQFPNKNTS